MNLIKTFYSSQWCQEFIIYIWRESLNAHISCTKHCIKLWCNISIKKKVLINKHWVKAAYFKQMRLWRCTQNWWRHCKIVSFCINALDLWCPWIMQQYVSKFFRGKFKYKGLLFLQRNSDGSNTSYGLLFNWKSTFSNLLTKARPTWLLYRRVILWSISDLHAPLKWDQYYFTTLYFNVYTHQSTATDFATSICNML